MALTVNDVIPKPQLANIPEELKNYDRWLLWKAEPSKKDPTLLAKVPKDINGDSFANWQDTSKLCSFEQIAKALERGKFDGIGFSPKDTPFVCVDLDNKESMDAIPAELAAIAKEGYAETSPSGRGIHVWMQAEAPPEVGRKRKTGTGDDIEIFSNSGWVTVTGDAMNSEPVKINQPFVDTIIQKYGFIQKPQEKAPRPPTVNGLQALPLSESEIIDKMLNSSDGATIRALLHGDASGYGNDYSSADFALCTRLAFWTGKDSGLMDTIFRSSGLFRPEKWDKVTTADKRTYGQLTIQKAIDGQHSTYTSKNEAPYSSFTILEGNGKKTPTVPEMAAIQKVASLNLSAMSYDDLTPAELAVISEEDKTGLYDRTSADHYIQSFINGVTASVNTPAISTGFDKLDDLLDGGLYEGLYIIGAISSLGKTTMVLQIADQIAQQGQDVILFSLEMARTEIMAKSISRTTLINALADGKPDNNAKSTRGITAGKRYENYSQYEKELIAKSVKDYGAYAGRVYIQEGLGNIGVNQVRQTVENHKKYTGNTPVVVIDYLQILAPNDPRATDKQNTDKAVLELKRLSRDFKTPVIGISSFNRENYKQPVSMTSFKESGAIEYSSDVLIGLQFQGMGRTTEDGKAIMVDPDAQKAKEPRKIELKILKNRNAPTGKSTNFDYFPKFNYFVETESEATGVHSDTKNTKLKF